MIMYDRVSGEKNSTVWLTKALRILDGDEADDEYEESHFGRYNEHGSYINLKSDNLSTPSDQYDNQYPISLNIEPASPPPVMEAEDYNDSDDSENSANLPSTDLFLCRICERPIPAILFEEHNEICRDIHREEMSLMLINDTLKERHQEAVEKIKILERECSDEIKEIIQNRIDKNLEKHNVYGMIFVILTL
jgi:hypothetical protein